MNFKGQDNPDWLLLNKTPLQTSPGIGVRSRSVSGRPGAHIYGVEIGARPLPFEVTILADNQEDLQDKAGQLSAWLFAEKPEVLTVSDQPGIYYKAIWADDGTFERLANTGKGPLTFFAGDPMKKANQVKTFKGQASVSVTNNGTYKTGFKAKIVFATGGTNYTIQNAAGAYITALQSFIAGDTLEILSNYEGENAIKLNGNYIQTKISLLSEFFKLPPGQQTLTISKGGTGETTVTIREERL